MTTTSAGDARPATVTEPTTDATPARATTKVATPSPELSHPLLIRIGLDNLAYAVAAQSDYVRAQQLFAEEVRLYQALDDSWGLASAMTGLGYIAGRQGDYKTARIHCTKALTIRRTDAEKWALTESLTLLGEIRQRQDGLEEAAHLFGECLRLTDEVGDKPGMAHVIYHICAQNFERTHARMFDCDNVQWVVYLLVDVHSCGQEEIR